MTRLAYKRLMLTPSQHLIPSEYVFGVSRYRTYGEVLYGDNLPQFDIAHFETATQVAIKSDMLCWSRPIISAEFWFLRRSKMQAAFSEKIRFERKARSRHRHLITYTNMETERYLPQTLRGHFAALPPCWRQIEVPKGSFSKLPPCLTYISSHIIDDPKSGYLSLIAADWATRVAVFLLWESYENYRLWFIRPMVRSIIKQLDLLISLGCQDNVEEVLYIPDVIDQVNCDTVPCDNHAEGPRNARDKSPGRRHPTAGDFVYYDPYVGATVSRPNSFEQRSLPRTIPAGHPTGLVFHDGYEPSVDFDDPMMNDEANESGGLHHGAVMDSVVLSNAGASHPSRALEGWSFVTQMSEPLAEEPLTIVTNPHVIALSENIRNHGIPVPPEMVDVGQLLALAAANYPHSTSHTGAVPLVGITCTQNSDLRVSAIYLAIASGLYQTCGLRSSHFMLLLNSPLHSVVHHHDFSSFNR